MRNISCKCIAEVKKTVNNMITDLIHIILHILHLYSHWTMFVLQLLYTIYKVHDILYLFIFFKIRVAYQFVKLLREIGVLFTDAWDSKRISLIPHKSTCFWHNLHFLIYFFWKIALSRIYIFLRLATEVGISSPRFQSKD